MASVPIAWVTVVVEEVTRSTVIVASLVTVVAGGLLVWRHWNDGTVFDEDTSKAFGLIVGIEFALAGIGAAVLGARRNKELIPAWIALVVGVHLFPVAVIIASPVTHVVGALVTIAALSAVPVARSRSLPVSVVIGAAAGTVLLVSAWLFLITAL